MMVTARRANLVSALEIFSVIALVGMLAASWLAMSSPQRPGLIMPSTQAAALLVGTLIPALALVVLFGRRRAIRRAEGGTARMHVRLVFFFSLSLIHI
jgi:two-component system nitrogen regulation sensor histidine kinase NtrY